MILFNLIFTRNLVESSKDFNILSCSLNKFSSLKKFRQKKIKLAYIVKKPDILSKSKESLAKTNFIKPNIFQKFFNTFWEQGVKYLVSKFSRSLFDGSIRSSFNEYNIINNNSNTDILYLWSKNLKLKQSYLFSLYNYLSIQANFNHLPVFTVSNNLGQMVISELPEGFNSRERAISYVSDKISNHSLYHGWFFINHNDAKEYMEHISQIYGLKKNSLQIFTCNISTLYKIMSKFNYKIEFR